jgi:hypothetical protein
VNNSRIVRAHQHVSVLTHKVRIVQRINKGLPFLGEVKILLLEIKNQAHSLKGSNFIC